MKQNPSHLLHTLSHVILPSIPQLQCLVHTFTNRIRTSVRSPPLTDPDMLEQPDPMSEEETISTHERKRVTHQWRRRWAPLLCTTIHQTGEYRPARAQNPENVNPRIHPIPTETERTQSRKSPNRTKVPNPEEVQPSTIDHGQPTKIQNPRWKSSTLPNPGRRPTSTVGLPRLS